MGMLSLISSYVVICSLNDLPIIRYEKFVPCLELYVLASEKLGHAWHVGLILGIGMNHDDLFNSFLHLVCPFL